MPHSTAPVVGMHSQMGCFLSNSDELLKNFSFPLKDIVVRRV